MFLESIRIYKNKPCLIKYHNLRLNNTIKHHFGNNTPYINISDYLSTDELNPNLEYKCRVIYSTSVISVEYEKYNRKIIKTIKAVFANKPIDYSYKKVLRPELDKLFEQRGNADEIMIIDNKGFITDAYYYNYVFEKESKFYTPETNLLPGVMRSSLIDKNKILLKNFHSTEIKSFERIHLINALNPLGKIKIHTENIVF